MVSLYQGMIRRNLGDGKSNEFSVLFVLLVACEGKPKVLVA